MKAERDDAPTYVRPSARRSNRSTWLVASFLGSILTVGMLYTLSALYMHDVADQILNGQKPKQAPIAEITRSAPTEKDWDRIVEDVARRSNADNREQARQRQQVHTKQTDYNSATYIPAHSVNSMPATRVSAQPSTAQKTIKQQEIVIVGKETRLKDYCPYREGSIERRNCKMRVDLNSR